MTEQGTDNPNIDIGSVLKKGSNEVDVSSLAKRGLKKVKVIKHSQIQALVSEAVDNSISAWIAEHGGDHEAAEEARKKVEEASKKEYEKLAEMKSLENQVIIAQKMERKLKEDLDQSTVVVAKLRQRLSEEEIAHNQTQMKLQDLAQLELLQDEVEALTVEADDFKEENDRLKSQLSASEERVRSVEGSVTENSQNYDESLLKLNDAKQENVSLKNQVEKLDAENESIKQVSLEREEGVKALESSLKEKDSELINLSNKINEIESEKLVLAGDIKGLSSDKEHSKELIDELKNKNSELESRLAEKGDGFNEAASRLKYVEEDKGKLELALNDSKEQLKNAEYLVKDGELALEKSRMEKEGLSEKLTFSEKQVQELKDEIVALKEVHEQSSEMTPDMMEALKGMMSEMKGEIKGQISKASFKGGSGSDIDIDVDPAILLKNAFNEKVESNLKTTEFKGKKPGGKGGKKLGKAKDKLKSLKGIL